jgi:hypothetical protein
VAVFHALAVMVTSFDGLVDHLEESGVGNMLKYDYVYEMRLA